MNFILVSGTFIFCMVMLVTIFIVTMSKQFREPDERMMTPTISAEEVQGEGSNVIDIVDALNKKAGNPFFGAEYNEKVIFLSRKVDILTSDVRRIQLKIMIFSSMLAGLTIILGIASAVMGLGLQS